MSPEQTLYRAVLTAPTARAVSRTTGCETGNQALNRNLLEDRVGESARGRLRDVRRFEPRTCGLKGLKGTARSDTSDVFILLVLAI